MQYERQVKQFPLENMDLCQKTVLVADIHVTDDLIFPSKFPSFNHAKCFIPFLCRFSIVAEAQDK